MFNVIITWEEVEGKMPEFSFIEQGTATCPYCGMLNGVKGDIHTMNVGLCDNELGGCDKYFAFRLSKTIVAVARKIDGEEETE